MQMVFRALYIFGFIALYSQYSFAIGCNTSCPGGVWISGCEMSTKPVVQCHHTPDGNPGWTYLLNCFRDTYSGELECINREYPLLDSALPFPLPITACKVAAPPSSNWCQDSANRIVVFDFNCANSDPMDWSLSSGKDGQFLPVGEALPTFTECHHTFDSGASVSRGVMCSNRMKGCMVIKDEPSCGTGEPGHPEVRTCKGINDYANQYTCCDGGKQCGVQGNGYPVCMAVRRILQGSDPLSTDNASISVRD